MIPLPRLPPNWQYAPIKRVANLRFSAVDKHSLPGETPVRLCNYVDVYRNEQITGRLDFMEATATKSEVSRLGVQAGDVLVTKDSETPGDIAVPACVREHLKGVVCGYHLALLRPRTDLVDGRFLHRALQAGGVRDQFYSTAVGVTRFALGLAEVGGALVPVPPLPAQRAIADFLDRKTAAIDALIEKKEELLGLLQAKGQALLTKAVSGGLDSAEPPKASGIEWLGRIPKTWKALPLRRWMAFLTDYEANGSFADTKENVSVDVGTQYAWYVRATDLEANRIGFAEDNRWCNRRSYEFLSKTRLSGGELLVVKRGEIGKVYLMPPLDCPATLAPNMYLVRLTVDLMPAWAHLWFSAPFGKAQLELANRSTTIGALYKNDLRECICVVPPLEDQKSILAWLRQRLDLLDGQRRETRRSIDLLREYRQALITAAVTGQLDIAAQPQEAA